MNELFFHECRAAGLVFKTSNDWCKWLTDNSYDIKNSVDTAKREGIAEGMEKGMELGMNQKALDIARNMLADGVDINLIMKYAGLTQEQIEK